MQNHAVPVAGVLLAGAVALAGCGTTGTVRHPTARTSRPQAKAPLVLPQNTTPANTAASAQRAAATARRSYVAVAVAPGSGSTDQSLREAAAAGSGLPPRGGLLRQQAQCGAVVGVRAVALVGRLAAYG